MEKRGKTTNGQLEERVDCQLENLLSILVQFCLPYFSKLLFFVNQKKEHEFLFSTNKDSLLL